jgi:NDP-sugar pyrophosphorylase family protein
LKAVILAGGMGKRLRPLTDDRPKAMIEIQNIPIIERQIQWLSRFGIREIVVCVGHLKEKIITHLNDGRQFDVVIDYISEEEPLGTGGALRNAREKIVLDSQDEGFFVINGDILTDINLIKLSDLGSNSIALVNLRSTFGIVETKGNIVSQFIEKPSIKDKWINAGIYFFSPQVFRYLPLLGNFELTTLPSLAKERKLKALKYAESYWRSIDSHKDVEEATEEIGVLKKLIGK